MKKSSEAKVKMFKSKKRCYTASKELEKLSSKIEQMRNSTVSTDSNAAKQLAKVALLYLLLIDCISIVYDNLLILTCSFIIQVGIDKD